MTVFDLDNPEKPIEIPTQPGCMHKANTSYDEDTHSLDNTFTEPIEQPPTEAEKRALHFFEAGLSIVFLIFSQGTTSSFSRRINGCCSLSENCIRLDLWFGKKR